MHGPQPANDELDRLRRQDVAAFTRLVDAHQAVVLGLCRSMGLRGADQEDAAADVFANVYLALPGFDGRSQLGTWVYTIACRTILKARARIRRVAPVGGSPRPHPAEPSAAERSVEEETRRQIWEAVARLDPRQALAVDLYYRRDWSVAEIAAVMECPAGTVKTLLFRAREELRQVFERAEIHP